VNTAEAGAATYVLALTWLLIVGGWVFVDNLEYFFGYAAWRGAPEQAEHVPEAPEAAGGHT
jgi:hypothetical protein